MTGVISTEAQWLLTGKLLNPRQELCRSQGDSQTTMHVNKHDCEPTSENTAFAANDVELADTGRHSASHHTHSYV